MKLAVLIFASKKNNGGHYYSNEVIVDALKTKIDVINILVAQKNCEIRNKSLYDFIVQENTMVKAISNLRMFLRSQNITHICSFDLPSAFISSAILLRDNYRHFHIKCGGKNNRRVYPKFDNTIFFSEENYKSNKSRSKHIELIPNRVKKFELDQRRINALRNKYNFSEQDKIILRISRFSTHYEASLYKLLNLAERVGDRYKFLIVGFIQEQEVYDSFKDVISRFGNIHLETDPYFTSNAKELIGIADYVIGTGRGAIEAASIGKKILLFSSRHNEPVLLTADNFDCFMKYNFSDRSKCNGELLSESVETIQGYEHFIRKQFETYFDIDNVIELYMSYIQNTVEYTFVKKINYFFRLWLIYIYKTRFKFKSNI